MTDSANGNTKDSVQLNLGRIVANVPCGQIRTAKKANTMSHVHRRPIDPLELTEQDNEQRLSFQYTFFHAACRTATPATTCASGSVNKAQCPYLSKPAKPGICRTTLLRDASMH